MNRFPGPPAYVPTLTDIVDPDMVPQAPSRATVDESTVPERAAATDLQALMIQRVLRHVDQVIEIRLLEATEQLLHAHVQALLPHLLDEIERVVRESVIQAFDREMPASPSQPESQKSTRS